MLSALARYLRELTTVIILAQIALSKIWNNHCFSRQLSSNWEYVCNLSYMYLSVSLIECSHLQQIFHWPLGNTLHVTSYWICLIHFKSYVIDSTHFLLSYPRKIFTYMYYESFCSSSDCMWHWTRDITGLDLLTIGLVPGGKQRPVDVAQFSNKSSIFYLFPSRDPSYITGFRFRLKEVFSCDCSDSIQVYCTRSYSVRLLRNSLLGKCLQMTF